MRLKITKNAIIKKEKSMLASLVSVSCFSTLERQKGRGRDKGGRESGRGNVLRFIIISIGEAHEKKHILHEKAISSMWRRLAAMPAPLNLTPTIILLSQRGLSVPRISSYITAVAKMNKEVAFLSTEACRTGTVLLTPQRSHRERRIY